MAIFKSTEQTCLDTLQKLHGTRGKLESSIVEHEAELAKLRAPVSQDSALDEWLAGAPAVDSEGFPTSGRVRAGVVEEKLENLKAARVALCRRIRAAIVDCGKARAAEFRHQAAKLQTLLDKHLARSAELLAELETHTRAKYRVNLLEGTTVLTDGAGRESVFRRGDIPMPRSQELASEVEILRRRADAAEARARNACEGGQVAASTLAELLKVCDNLETLAPTRAAIEAWYTEASARAAAEWATTAAEYVGALDTSGRFRVAAPEHDTVYSLVWSQDGVIDTARSNAKNRPGRLTMPAAASVGA